jgi:hypothetical protein
MDQLHSTVVSVLATAARAGASLMNSLRKLITVDERPYRPEKYYMRGPGPKYRAKLPRKPARVPSIFS